MFFASRLRSQGNLASFDGGVRAGDLAEIKFDAFKRVFLVPIWFRYLAEGFSVVFMVMAYTDRQFLERLLFTN